MTLMEERFMGISSQRTTGRASGSIAREIGAWLGRRYPAQTIKNVSADLGCSYKSAENLLNGHLSAAQTARLLTAYGPRIFIEASLSAAGSSLDQYIMSEAERADEERRRWAATADRYQELGRRLGSADRRSGDDPGARPRC